MKIKRIFAVLLALCLSLSLLSACGDGSSDGGASDGLLAQEVLDIYYTELSEAVTDDIVYYLSTHTLTSDDVVLTVGDTTVTAAEMLHWAAVQEYRYQTYYYLYGVTLDLSEEVSEGITMGDMIMSDALDTTIMYTTAGMKARELGIELDPDTAASLATFREDQIRTCGESVWNTFVDAGFIDESECTEEERDQWITTVGETDYQYSLLCYATNHDAYMRATEDAYYTAALQEYLFGEGGEYAPTEATLADYLESYVEDHHITTVRYILFSTDGATTDEAVEEIRVQAEGIYNDLLNTAPEDREGLFCTLQETYNADGNTKTFTFDDNSSLVDGFVPVAQATPVGELAMTDLTDYGYFIILRYEPDTTSYVAQAESLYVEDTFSALIDQWSQEYGVEASSKLGEINPIAFFVNLDDLRNEIAVAVTSALEYTDMILAE